MWPFNFTEKNNAGISSTGGLEIARHGTAYTTASPEKIGGLQQFTVLLDLETASDGHSAFEKIFMYAVSQEELNFLFGQWKDGFLPIVRIDQRKSGIKLSIEDALKLEKRTRFLLTCDGSRMRLYQDGSARNTREAGATFENWSREYPLTIGSDASGRGQWKGTIYELAVFDRALSSDEVKGLSSHEKKPLAASHKPQGMRADSRQPTADSRQQETRKENPPVSPFVKGGYSDDRPLIHYVFRPENTYETEFRGRKALAVKDLGKGESADLVIPETFEPFERAFLKWRPDWAQYKSNWLDLAVNIIGFIPFGALLLLIWELGIGRRGFGGGQGEIAAHPSDARNDKAEKENPPVSPFVKEGGLVWAVILTVVGGVVVSFAIEYLQAYLPSRDSSIRDLVTNGAGTMIGALAAVWYLRKRATAASA